MLKPIVGMLRSPEHQVWIGCIAGGVLTLLRLVALARILFADGPVMPSHIAAFVAKVLVGAALTYGIYRRYHAAAVAYLVLGMVGLGTGLYVGSPALPWPSAVALLLIVGGLALGVRGTATLQAHRAQKAPAA